MARQRKTQTARTRVSAGVAAGGQFETERKAETPPLIPAPAPAAIRATSSTIGYRSADIPETVLLAMVHDTLPNDVKAIVSAEEPVLYNDGVYGALVTARDGDPEMRLDNTSNPHFIDKFEHTDPLKQAREVTGEGNYMFHMALAPAASTAATNALSDDKDDRRDAALAHVIANSLANDDVQARDSAFMDKVHEAQDRANAAEPAPRGLFRNWLNRS
jgi:hypothetical protein